MDFTSRQLRAFLLVAQHRSFSRAAEALFITPSGLSVLIRELEAQFGFRLFERTTRHVTPTPYGAELITVVQRNLAELDAATSRIGQSANQADQSLILGAPPLISANIMVQAIKEFRAHRPSLQVRLYDEKLSTILQLVQSGKLDMGLGTFGSATGVRRTPFLRSPLIVIRPDKDPAFRRATTTWSALRNERLITLQPTGHIQQVIWQHLAQEGIKSRPNTSINLLDTQIAMVEADEGVAIIPSFGLAACRNRRVIVSRLVNPIVTIGLYLISNRAKKLPPDADKFTTFLKSFVGRWIGHREAF
jgi:LysR family transcriptional regulator, carnitine catabolism transcriptional activator